MLKKKNKLFYDFRRILIINIQLKGVLFYKSQEQKKANKHKGTLKEKWRNNYLNRREKNSQDLLQKDHVNTKLKTTIHTT